MLVSVISFILIILFAAILQTSTGFGFSLMATPFLLILFDVHVAIQINLILSLFISCALVLKVRKDVDFRVIKRFTFGSLAGLPIGIIIFLVTEVTFLKLGISVLILILTILLVLNFRTEQTNKRDFVVGGLSGTLTSSIGMPGPPILLYFAGTNTTKEVTRGTALTFYLFVYFVSLLIHIVFAGTTKDTWTYSLLAIPVLVVGLYLGQLIFKWINQTVFQRLTYILLFFTGIYLLIEQL